MRTFIKYVLLEIPGWVLLAFFLWVLVNSDAVPRWGSIAFFVIWVVKDLVQFPWLRSAYEGEVRTGTERLVGMKASAQSNLDPEGYVRINGELWRAQVKTGNPPIRRHSGVRILGARGLTLLVELDGGEKQSDQKQSS
jgi:membrane protein implicated in regulation of membrane protease activity